MRYRVTYFLFFPVCIWVFRCGDPKQSPTGSTYWGRELLDVVGPVSLPLQSFASVQDIRRSNDKSSLLYIYRGAAEDHQAQSIILFAPPDSGRITRALLKWTLDTASVGGVEGIEIYAWSRSWQEGVSIGTPLMEMAKGSPLAIVRLDTIRRGTSYSVALDPEWMSSQSDTFGVILATPISDFTASLFSQDNVTGSPALLLWMNEDTTAKTRYPVRDAFYASRPPITTLQSLPIDNATSLRLRLRFDLSCIPPTATLNLARLILYVDPEVNSPLPEASFTVLAYPIITDTTEIPQYDVSLYGSGVVTGDSLVVSIQSFAQKWSGGLLDNAGVLLIGGLEKKSITRRAFLIGGDEKRRPRLEVYYTPSAAPLGVP